MCTSGWGGDFETWFSNLQEELVPATLAGTPPLLAQEIGPQALVSHFVDLSVVVPALVVADAWLLQRRSWDYVLAGVGLVLGALLAPTITGMTIALLVTEDVTVPLVAAVVTVLLSVVAAGLAGTYLLAMSRNESARQTDRAGQPT